MAVVTEILADARRQKIRPGIKTRTGKAKQSRAVFLCVMLRIVNLQRWCVWPETCGQSKHPWSGLPPSRLLCTHGLR